MTEAKEDVRIRLLGDSDREVLLALSEESGWNQLWPDWERLLRLYPDGVFGAEIAGKGLVGTSSVAAYGEACCWLGMVLVRRTCRGGGLGKLVFETALQAAIDRGIRNIGLDAADMGRPIYLKYGFVDSCPISRWSGTLSVRHGMLADYVRASDWADIAALDRRHTEVDRLSLLQRLASEPDVRAWVCRDSNDHVTGYGILRPGRQAWQLGPVVVDDDRTFARILDTAAHFLDGRTVFMDVFHPPVEQQVQRRGLQKTRILTRMFLGHVASHLSGEGVCCGAGFELG